MIDIEKIASNLAQDQNGIWHSRHQSPISYPEEGNAHFHTIEEFSFWFRHRNLCITEAMQAFPPCGTLFDIGGGNGFVSLALQNAGVETVMVEPGWTGIQYAQERGIRYLIHSTLEDAGFTSQSFPSVGLFDVLEHIEEDVAFLRRIYSLLIPGGRFYLTVPAYMFLWSDADDYAGHRRRYTRESLSAVLLQAGFSIEYSTYIFWPLIFPILLYRSFPYKATIRKQVRIETYQEELVHSHKWVNRLLDRILGLEVKSIRRGKKIPFGGSCFVIAKKEKNDGLV